MSDGKNHYEMSPTDYNTEGLNFSLRNLLLAVFLFLIVRLGSGLARGLLEGDYLIGTLGLILALVPIIWLLSIIRKAYF